MTASFKSRANAGLALGAGLALRLYLVLKFPMNNASDSATYIDLAQNWLRHGIYGVAIQGQIVPVDVRPPGYPAFLVAASVTLGGSHLGILLAQAVVDLATCCVVALLAARIASAAGRKRAALAGLWIAALCPFVANYTTGILTEVLATFFTALALLVLAEGFQTAGSGGSLSGQQGWAGWIQDRWFLGGLVVGLGTLVRPETPLLLAAAGLALLARWWRPANWPKLVRAGILMFVGMLLPLLPWAARNWRAVGEVQFLAPRYTQLPGEFVPRGFFAWTNTWLWRFRDVYLVPWKLDDEEISMDDIPAYAFDSQEQRDRVAAILDEYNDSLTISPEEDAQFADLARERTALHPLRTYFSVPLKRAFALWFTPRIELLPFSGDLWPIHAAWQEDPVDFSVTVAFGALAILLAAAAMAGAWLARKSPAVPLLVAFCVVRTIFFLHYETPEPRYVLECFPAVIALAAQVFAAHANAGAGAATDTPELARESS
jgi:4-amino-4-deoxy-L-arabinose transferase-like glycosyltransferase